MLRGIRLAARAGWQFEEKTQQRYENGKAEGYISALTPSSAAYELEDIFHEEEPLRVLRRLEEEGWSKALSPALQSAKANEAELERLRDLVDQLQTMGIFPDPSAANFPLLTAKMAPKDVADLKKSFARPGFVEQIESLEASTKEFAARFNSKSVAAPSDTWKLLLSSPPEQVLWLAYSSKNAGVQARFKAFFEEWPSARQRIPYGLMQEMRITADLPGYSDLLESLFFALMDGKLETPEAIREFLSPYSPPAPPPPAAVRRRPAKRESKPRGKAKPAVDAAGPDAEESAATPLGEAAGSREKAGASADTKKVTPKKGESARKREGQKHEAGAAKKAGPEGANSAKKPPTAAKPTAAAAKKPVEPAASKKAPAKASPGKSAAKAAARKVAAKAPATAATPKRTGSPHPPVKAKAAAKTAAKPAPAKKQAAKTTPKKAAKKDRK